VTGEPGDAMALLAGGEIELIGLMPRASNYTFLAEVTTDRRTVLAVYKPRDGEMPLWDFPEGTLHRREVAAYELSRALGWPGVPPTVLREGPHGPGSVQLFVEVDPRQHFFTLRDTRLADFRPVALFDVVANNADRKAGHCMLAADGSIWVIDHGVCFSEAPKLRTVIWDFADEPIPEALRADLERVAAELRNGSGDLGPRMRALLSEDEVEAAVERAQALLSVGRFPPPGPGRPYPWPPV
jgi:uncharacterized repeat protein (TIGR03843 family)